MSINTRFVSDHWLTCRRTSSADSLRSSVDQRAVLDTLDRFPVGAVTQHARCFAQFPQPAD